MARFRGAGKYHLTTGDVEGKTTVTVKMLADEYCRRHNETCSLNIIYGRLKDGHRDLELLVRKKSKYRLRTKEEREGVRDSQKTFTNFYNDMSRFILKTI